MTPSYCLGLFFILLVVIIWSLASILVQDIYQEHNFDSPFMLTYICTSLFVLLLPNRLIWELFTKHCTDNEKIKTIAWKSGPLPHQYQELSNTNDSEENEQTSLNENKDPEEVDSHSESPPLCNNDENEMENLTKTEMFVDNFILGHYETLRISMMLAPIWFFANYSYNLSLQLTSITSSTIIASTGSLFTFLIAVFTKDEKFTPSKCLGIGFCMLGSIITGLNDNINTESENGTASKTALWGDLLGLCSAMGYGVYTVLIRLKCPKDEKHISMQLLFGYIGLLNMIALSPLVLYQYLSYRTKQGQTSEPKPWISWTVIGLLVLKGVFDNVLSDYLWARSIVLTSATVATVGLGLTIPFAVLSDWLISEIIPNVVGILGGLSVLFGFILVNVDTQWFY